jgi:predicted YcjX-like family ATPase
VAGIAKGRKASTSEWTQRAIDWTDKTKSVLEEKFARTMDRSVRLAVTGLSRSGKTVFTMSVVHLLKYLRTQPDLLAHLGVAEVVSVQVSNPPNLDAARFPYEQSIGSLSEDPRRWPESTRNVSEVRVTVRYRRERKHLMRLGDGVHTLHLDIIDYPGEWLLDLPLLDKSFSEWSRQAIALAEQPPRAKLAAKWRAFANGFDAVQSAVEADERIREGAALFRDYLLASRQAGLQFVQPGRFLLPGDLEGKLFLEFFPMLGPKAAPEDSLIAEFERRYDAFREQVIGEFRRRYFAGFDRQVVLADILTVLNTGQCAFVDTRDALNEILESFRYGDNSWLTRLFRPKIDRVLIAATKADRVSRDQSPLLRHFLEAMLGDTRESLAASGKHIQFAYRAISALCCTRDIKCSLNGVPASCIQGVPVDGSELVTFFPGQVPSCPPADDDWQGYNFRDFLPPSGRYQHGKMLDHLQMHEVLRFLIGDKI